MRRYQFLKHEEVYSALNKLRDLFLAAQDGNEVDEIINGVLTQDEKLKIGRRILIAELVSSGAGIDDISRTLRVGKNTIVSVMKSLDAYPKSLVIIEKRNAKVQDVYSKKKFKLLGGSNKIFKTKIYTGFKRKDVKR